MKNLSALLLVIFIVFSVVAVPCHAIDSGIILTEDELAFIEEHPIIRLGVDPKFIPFEFFDDSGEYTGITNDYLALISEKTGLEFEVAKGMTWPEAYDKALAGELDMLPAISITEEREQHFHFSEPYFYFKRVIVTRDSETGISDLDDLGGLTVSVQRNSSHHSYLLSYPNINLSLYDSVEIALTAVANGTERAFVGNLATTNYLVRSNALTNLKFIAFEAEKEQALHFAVRNDWPELVNILNKSLDALSDEEKFVISNEWIEFESEVDYGPILRTILFAGIFLAVVMAISLFWINRLRKEVKKRQLIQIDLEHAKRAAEENNEFKSSFMARMSHEIRTPLNAISGLSYLLRKTEVNNTQGMYIDRISRAANTMLGIVNDILDFSKIEAGKVELEITSFSLDQVLQDVVNIVTYKIEEKGIGFKWSKDSKVPNWFLGDPTRIQQILLNVLSNAAKFTDSGEVTLEVRLNGKEEMLYHLLFSVRDTGIGMTDDQVSKLFNPFTQGDSSINRRYGGSGLGMSIVRNLVEMMGGKIEVNSTPEVGSEFNIYLSLNGDKQKEQEPSEILYSIHIGEVLAAGTQASHSQETKINQASTDNPYCVLLAEDNQTNQLIAQTLLRQAGIISIEALNGQAAVDLYKRDLQKIDLILMDLHMPVMNGYEAAKEIRKISADVPIVAMTADVIQGVKEKCEQYGIHHYISKPFDPDYFIQLVKQIISKNEDHKNLEITVLNWAAGLKNLGGDQEVYKQVLDAYYDENKDTADRLEFAIQAHRYNDAVQIVHKAKGSSGSIGARSLYDLSVKLQRALSDENEKEIVPLKEQFHHLIKKLLKEIESHLN